MFYLLESNLIDVGYQRTETDRQLAGNLCVMRIFYQIDWDTYLLLHTQSNGWNLGEPKPRLCATHSIYTLDCNPLSVGEIDKFRWTDG